MVNKNFIFKIYMCVCVIALSTLALHVHFSPILFEYRIRKAITETQDNNGLNKLGVYFLLY